MERYKNRKEAGQVLADNLKTYANHEDVIVLALPRGGVPVAYEVAKQLKVPLDVFIVRKLGVPGHEELAMGALATGEAIVFNEEIVESLKVSPKAIEQVIEQESQELKRRELAYRGNRPFPNLKDKTVILVDDGIATGASIRAAIVALRRFKPKEIIIAVPVAEINTCKAIAKIADKVICPLKPEHFYAVGAWYEYFDQTSDAEVKELLEQAGDAEEGTLLR